MKSQPHGGKPTGRASCFRTIAVILLSPCWMMQVATGEGGSVFEALEIRPAELVASTALPPLSSLATLPASSTEREQLITALLESADPAKANIAVQLVEIGGNHAAAIQMFERQVGGDPSHLVRLLYRTGQAPRAASVFAAIQTAGGSDSGLSGMPRFRTFAAVWPFIIEGRHAEMAKFLAWLQPQCRRSEWMSAVLAQRLELALHSGRLKPWLQEIARESPLAHAIANRWLDPSTPEIVPQPGMPIHDLAWIGSIEGGTAANAPLLKRAIESGDGEDVAREDLLSKLIEGRVGPSQVRMDLLKLWMTRDAEFIAMIKRLRADPVISGGLPFAELCDLAAKHPEDFLLNFIAGCNQTRRFTRSSTRPVTQSAIDSLVRSFLAAPLLESAPDFDSRIHLSDPDGRGIAAPRWSHDTAFRALSELSPRLPSTRLYELVHRHREFANLALHGRHRYLRAAALDIPASRLIFEIDWTAAANDRAGAEIGISLGSAPPEMVRKYYEILPQVMLGSPRKPAKQVAAHSVPALRLLFHQHTCISPEEHRMVATWAKGLAARGPVYVDEVMTHCVYQKHAQSNEMFRGMFGAEAADRLRRLRAERKDNEAKASSMAWFGPAGLHGFPFGYEPQTLVRSPILMTSWPGGLFGDYPEYPPAAWLAPRYPALAAILEANKFSANVAQSRAGASRIRALLPATSPLAAGYDIALLTGDIPAPEAELRKQAFSHVGRLLAQANDADFVFRRASRGVTLAHARPPEHPAAVEELMILREAPTPMQMAARDMATWCGNEFRQRILAVFDGPPGRKHRNLEPLPEPPPPVPPDIPALHQMALDIPTAEALIDFLSKLPESHGISLYVLLCRDDILARFQAPQHPLLLKVLRVRHEPATGLSGTTEPMRPPSTREIEKLHQFLCTQGPEAARTFRQLVITRGWGQPASVAAALLRQGEREEAVNWLATAILAGCYPSSVWQGPHRFPQPRQQYYLGSLERSLPHDSLWLITREKLALPVAAAMEPMPHGDDPVLLGFLRFFDAPSIESFDRHLGGLDTPENPNMTANLAIHIAGVLRHHRESAHLVEELRKHARKFD